MRGIKITELDIDKFCDLYEKSYTLSEISQITGFEYKTVRTYLKSRGYKKFEKIHGYIADEIIEKYKNGETILNLSNEYHFKNTTISTFLKTHGVELRRFKFTKEDIEFIAADYFNGMSLHDLAIKYNSNINTISESLNRYNIKRRTHSESMRKYELNEHYFDEIDTPNKAYILGFFYTDGYVSKKDNGISIDLQEKDKHILEEMRKEFESTRPLYLNTSNNQKNPNWGKVWQLSLNSKIMHDALCKHGVIPLKTFNLKYPDFLKDNLHSHFIRGLIDGDGSIAKLNGNAARKRYSVTLCGTKDLCDGVKYILEKYIGIKSSVNFHKTSNIWVLTCSSKKSSVKFLDWIYKDADMKLKRKYDIYLEFYSINKNIT